MRLGRAAGRVTLVELLLICVILAVIGALAIPNWAASRRRAAEASAQTALKSIVSAQGTFRQCDHDRNGAQDYWTIDVAGLYGIQDSNGRPVAAITAETAEMDSAPAVKYPGLRARGDLSGYVAIAMSSDENKSTYVDPTLARVTAAPLSGRIATNTSKYGFCAYPRVPSDGVVAQFVVNEEGVVYRIDGIPAPVVSYSSICPPEPFLGSG